MFGMGMGEIVLIAVVALLVLGPERLPGAAKAIGKGIRDLRQQSKDLQSTIEKDTQIGDAVREIRTALRGDPESLYKAATGEDFDPDAKGKPGSAAEAKPGLAAEAKGEQESPAPFDLPSSVQDIVDSAEAPPTPQAPPAATPPEDSDDLHDKAYANNEDGWGQAASNPHEEVAARDPDLPLIRTPAGATARGSDDDQDHG